MEEMMKVRHGFSMATIGKDGGRKTMSYLKLKGEKEYSGKLHLLQKTYIEIQVYFSSFQKVLLGVLETSGTTF